MSSKLVSLFFAFGLASFAQLEANGARGPEILKEKGCSGCHAVTGGSATVKASALTRPLNREYTPAGFTATLWNHAPRMFSAIRKERGSIPQVSEGEAADLFAYFASLRYFEPMGESARGARLFQSKKCAECHASGPGAPVQKWQSLGDPIELAAAMWNHQPKMQAEMTKRGIRHPGLTAQELADILVYARSLPGRARSEVAMMQMPSLNGTDKLLDQYGCNGCHKGEMAFGRIIGDQSMTEIAAAMWNHGPKMTSAARAIPAEEMRKLVGWIWTRQIVEPDGNAGRGERLAKQRKCMDCHSGGGMGPAFAKLNRPYTVVQAASAIWKHGPAMMAAMEQKGFRWPRFTAADVDDLLAFISSHK